MFQIKQFSINFCNFAKNYILIYNGLLILSFCKFVGYNRMNRKAGEFKIKTLVAAARTIATNMGNYWKLWRSGGPQTETGQPNK